MTYNVANAEFLMLTLQASNIQYDIMRLAHLQQKLTMETAQISEQKARKMTFFLQSVDQEADLLTEVDFSAAFIDLDKQAAIIQAKEKQINTQKLYSETKLKEIEARKESVKKLKEQETKEIALSSK